MNKYQSYKSSSVDWIGEIPSSWDSGKMKYVLSNNDGGVWGTDIEDEGVGTLVVRSTEITIEGNWDLSQILKRKLTESEVFKCKLYEGDIVITKSSGSPQHIGKSVLVSKEIEDLNCCYSNFVQRIRFKDYNSKLYHYILNSEIVREQFKYLTTSSTGLGNLNGTSLNDVLIPFIPLNEQIQIVQYLDEKTGLIDNLISTKERKITLIKEQRKSLINQVVTKGLNPNVKMKDSGIEWIGDIPEHWCLIKMKHKGDVIIGLSYSPDNIVDEGEGTLVMRSSNVQNGEPTFLDNVYVNSNIPDKIRLREGDILICSRNGSRNLIGKNCLITKNEVGLTFGVFMTIYRTQYYKFIYWLLNSPIFESQSGLFLTSTINQLTVSTLQNMVLPFVDDIEEQNEIIGYLNSKTKEIDDLVQLEQKKIDLLKEYRQSLISEVVTGKIKVTTD
jgi:type I restriction enzyme S subunit